jgi:hypothetical protein
MVAKQIEAFLSLQDDLADRDMALVSVTGDKASYHFGPHLGATAEDIRRRLDIKHSGFTVILVGKDTGVKLRRTVYTKPHDIFDLIDSMPMRRREMRQIQQ